MPKSECLLNVRFLSHLTLISVRENEKISRASQEFLMRKCVRKPNEWGAETFTLSRQTFTAMKVSNEVDFQSKNALRPAWISRHETFR
jgi:hypothetical protein